MPFAVCKDERKLMIFCSNSAARLFCGSFIIFGFQQHTLMCVLCMYGNMCNNNSHLTARQWAVCKWLTYWKDAEWWFQSCYIIRILC